MSDNPKDNGESLPVSVGRRLDQVCNRFEDAWRAGQRPSVAAFLAEAAGPAGPALLRELLRLDFEYRGRAGERPAPEDYLGQFPEQAELILAAFREFFPEPPAGEQGCAPETLGGPRGQPTQAAPPCGPQATAA